MSKAASPKTIPDTAPPESESSAGPGVRSLLSGRGREVSPASEPAAAPVPVSDAEKKSASSELPFPLWYLFAADILLLLLAFFLVFKDPANLSWKRVALAVAVTVVGGILAVAGVFLGQKK